MILESEPAATAFPAAELDRRFYAFTLDRLIAWATYAAAAFIAYHFLMEPGHVWGGIGLIVGVVVLVGVGFAILLGQLGMSPGKAVVGLRVVHATTGAPIGVPPAMLRAAVLGVAALPTFGLGLATLAWTAVMDQRNQRRGWHDHLTNSVVVDVRDAPVDVEVVEAGPRHIVNLTAMRLVPTPTPTPTAVPAPTRTPRPPTPPATTTGQTTAERTLIRSGVGLGHWRVTFDTGESFLVEGLALVGRQPEARQGEPVRHLVALRSSDMSLSKTHAQMQVAPDGILVVMDRSSTNGSIVIRQGVSKLLSAGKPATLLEGDRVRFGDRQMTVAREA